MPMLAVTRYSRPRIVNGLTTGREFFGHRPDLAGIRDFAQQDDELVTAEACTASLLAHTA